MTWICSANLFGSWNQYLFKTKAMLKNSGRTKMDLDSSICVNSKILIYPNLASTYFIFHFLQLGNRWGDCQRAVFESLLGNDLHFRFNDNFHWKPDLIGAGAFHGFPLTGWGRRFYALLGSHHWHCLLCQSDHCHWTVCGLQVALRIIHKWRHSNLEITWPWMFFLQLHTYFTKVTIPLPGFGSECQI